MPGEPSGAAGVDLRQLRWVLDLDRRSGWVKVQPGITFWQLTETLAGHGLALRDPPSDPSLTVAEGLTTGAPGSRVDCGSLASQIDAIELVDGTGRGRTVSEGNLLLAAQVGLGVMGVPTAVTFHCEPAYNLRVRLEACRTDDALGRLDELRAGSGYLELTWVPDLDRCLVMQAERTGEEPGGQAWAVPSRALRRGGGRSAVTSWLTLAAADVAGRALSWVDRGHRVLLRELAVPGHGSVCALPATTAAQIWRTVGSWLGDHGGAGGQPIRFRFGAGDHAFLSPAGGRDTVWIQLPAGLVPARDAPGPAGRGDFVGSADGSRFGASMDRPSRVRLANELGVVLAGFGARPQWGQHVGPLEHLAGRYPHWTEWCEARRELDPHGLFEPAAWLGGT